MSEVDFSVQIIPDKFQEFRVNSSASAAEVMARILKIVSADSSGKVDPNEYCVLIAYQLLSPELSLEKLFQQTENGNPLGFGTLGNLGVKTGYYVLFIKPTVTSTKLELDINGEVYVVDGQDVFIGRKDNDNNIFPDIDLTPYLEQYENKVSRKLITIHETEGKWLAKLHPDAQSSVFLDGNKLRHGEEREIGSAINIGNTADDPYIRIKTRLISD